MGFVREIEEERKPVVLDWNKVRVGIWGGIRIAGEKRKEGKGPRVRIGLLKKK